MKKNLDEINEDIINKINNLEVEDNIKDFLKEALLLEYSNRDVNFESVNSKRNTEYGPIIEKYYKR